MPAGGGDRRPRTAGHARGHRTRRRHLRRPRRCAPNEVRIIAHRRRRDRANGPTRCWCSPAMSARSPSPGRPRPTAISTATQRRGWRRSARRLADGGERIVHRMGDLGWFDARRPAVVLRPQVAARGGRRRPLCTEQVEPVFNTHPDVRRTALVGIGARGAQRPVLCVELRAGRATGAARPRIVDELRAHRPTATRTPRKRRHFPVPSEVSRSTSATTPRSAARNSRLWAEQALRKRQRRQVAHEDPRHRRRRLPRPGAVPRAASSAATRSSASIAAATRRSMRSACARCRATSPIAMRCSPPARGVRRGLPQRGQGRRVGQLRQLPPRQRRRHARTSSTPAARTASRRLVYTSTPSVTHRATHPVEGGTADTVPYGERLQGAVRDDQDDRRTGGARRQRCRARDGRTAPAPDLGPRRHQLLPRLVDRARAGRLRFVGDGENLIDTTYIDNAAQAHFDAFDAPRARRGLRGPRVLHQQRRTDAGARDRQRPAAGGRRAAGRQDICRSRVAYAIGAVCEAAWTLLPLRGEPPMTRFLAEQLSTTHWYDMAPATRDFGYVPTGDDRRRLARLRHRCDRSAGARRDPRLDVARAHARARRGSQRQRSPLECRDDCDAFNWKPHAGRALEAALNRALALDPGDPRRPAGRSTAAASPLQPSARAAAGAAGRASKANASSSARSTTRGEPDLGVRSTLGGLIAQLPFFRARRRAAGGAHAHLRRRRPRAPPAAAGRALRSGLAAAVRARVRRRARRADRQGRSPRRCSRRASRGRNLAESAAEYVTEESRDVVAARRTRCLPRRRRRAARRRRTHRRAHRAAAPQVRAGCAA